MEDKAKRITSFKEVMGNYPTGVTVVTAFNEDGVPMGLTVNSFASVSLDPMLILWSIDKNVGTYDEFLKTDQFAVNILASDQGNLCTLFATRGEDRFAKCEWEKSALNLPVLSDTLATFQCKTYRQVDAGDHMILIGEVVDIRQEDKEPLLYHQRRFGGIPKEFYN